MAETLQSPSASDGKSQYVAEPTTKVHASVTPPFVALTVTTSPAVPPATLMPGVESAVMSSTLEAPVSEAFFKFGDGGADGGVVSICIDSGELAVDVLPAGSVSVALTLHVPSVSVGRSQLVAAPIT